MNIYKLSREKKAFWYSLRLNIHIMCMEPYEDCAFAWIMKIFSIDLEYILLFGSLSSLCILLVCFPIRKKKGKQHT